MAQVFDIENEFVAGDLKITAGGDFNITESTLEHQQELILACKGDFKQNPTIGVDVFNYIDSDNNDLTNKIAREFSKDGMNVKSVKVLSNLKIQTDASY